MKREWSWDDVMQFVREIERVDRFAWTSPERLFGEAEKMVEEEMRSRGGSVTSISTVTSIASLVKSINESLHMRSSIEGSREGSKEVEGVEG